MIRAQTHGQLERWRKSERLGSARFLTHGQLERWRKSERLGSARFLTSREPGFNDRPGLFPRAAEHLASWLLALVALAAFVGLALLQGCVPAQAVRHAREHQAIHAGHVRDAALPLEARLVAQDAYDAFGAQREALGDAAELPTGVELEPEERVE